MSVEKLNPNHPMSQSITDNDTAIKLLTVLVHKIGGKATITAEDINALPADTVMLFDGGSHEMSSMCLEIVSRKEAERLVSKEGGLPV